MPTRIYISPRFEVEPNHTRNILATLVNYPETFEEVVNVSRNFGLCFVDALETTHNNIGADGRAIPISLLYSDVSAYSIGLAEIFDSLSPTFLATAKAKIESSGINIAWVSGSNSLRDVIRYLIKAILLVQILEGQSNQDFVDFLKNNLDITVGDVPLKVRNAVKSWMQNRGLAIGWIKGTSTVREVLHFILENLGFGKFRINTEEF